MVRVGAAVVAICAGNALFAEESSAINPKANSDWKCGWDGKGGKSLTADEADGALACKGSVVMFSNDAIKVDPDKNYKLTGEFKLAPDSKPSKFYLGLMPLDDNGGKIDSASISIAKDTNTELAADCHPEDTVVKIKNGEKWQLGQFYMVAFKTDDSGKNADLPNRELSGWNVVSVEKNGDVFDVTLKNKCGKEYPAGTKVREHRSGASFIYFVANKDVPADWQEFSSTFTLAKCWPGTKSAKIVVLANYGGKPDQAMLLKNIKLEEVK